MKRRSPSGRPEGDGGSEGIALAEAGGACFTLSFGFAFQRSRDVEGVLIVEMHGPQDQHRRNGDRPSQDGEDQTEGDLTVRMVFTEFGESESWKGTGRKDLVSCKDHAILQDLVCVLFYGTPPMQRIYENEMLSSVTAVRR